MLPIGQLPDAANAIALVCSYSAAASCLAASSRWCFVLLGIGAPPGSFFPMVLCYGGASHKALRHGAPTSNKPHSAEKSTPVWLAVWRIWAGFANSQLLRATFHSIYLYTCAHPHCCYLGSAAQTDANLSAHLHRLPTPPPYLLRMRLLHGRDAGVGYGCYLARCIVPANHRAHESLF